MTRNNGFLILLAVCVLTLASCGGGDVGATTSTTAATSGGVATTAVSTTGTEPANDSTTTMATTTTAAPDDEAAGKGQAELVFDDGRSWSLNGSCVYTPDNTGPASALWNVEVEATDGASVIAIMAFPFDAAKTDPVLIGNFVDADDNVFVFIESEDVSAGSNLILNLGIHDGIKTIDDPIDITATLTCGL